MKRFFLLAFCLLLVSNIFTLSTAATELDERNQVIISQTVEDLGNGSFFIETIYVPSIQLYSSTKTGTKMAQFIYSGEPIFAVSVTGTFTYDGSTSDATSSLCEVVTYVEDAEIVSCVASTSGASAVGTGSVKYKRITIPKTVTLTCDKDGNLS